ncbi:MAG: hypothetical protein QW620_03135 [Thermoplasmata archaeon]
MHRLRVLFIATLLLSVAIISFQTSQIAYGEDYTAPGKVNKLFGNFTTPVIKPGENGILNFTIRNYYSTPVYNIVLVAEIYFYATIETGKKLSDGISNPPKFRITGNQIIRQEWSEWRVYAGQPYNQYNTVFGISTARETPEGTYFVRFILTFYDPNGNQHILKSRGCFTNEEWKEATTNVSDYDMNYHGGVNISKLGVDGILPDTSFTVSSGPNLVLFFFLVGLTIFFACLTVMFYLNETKGMFPWLQHITYRWKGKFNQFRAMFKKRLKKK